MKKVGGMNDEDCRKLAKRYLSCRMDKYVFLSIASIVTTSLRLLSNLMAPDSFENLGLVFKEDQKGQGQTGPAVPEDGSQANQAQ